MPRIMRWILPPVPLQAGQYAKCLLVLALVAIAWGGHGQNSLPVNKYPDKSRSMYQRVKDDFFDGAGTSLQLGYHHTYFLNANFAQHVTADRVNIKPGLSASFRLIAWFPLIMDLSWFSSKYGVDDSSWYYTDDDKVRHRGLEVSASLVLLPLENAIMPYLGVGYQLGGITVGKYWYQKPYDNPGSNQQLYTLASSKCSSPIWKVGLLVNVNAGWFVNGEYKQSIKTSELKSFNQLSVGVGKRF